MRSLSPPPVIPERPRADAAEELDLPTQGRLVCFGGRGTDSRSHLLHRSNGTERKPLARSAGQRGPGDSDTIRYESGFTSWKRLGGLARVPVLAPGESGTPPERASGTVGRVGARFRLPVVRVLSRLKGAKTEIFQNGARQPVFSFEPPRRHAALSGFPLDIHESPVTRWWHDLLLKQCLPLRLDLPSLHSAQPPPGREFRVAAEGSTLPWSVLQLSQDKGPFRTVAVPCSSGLAADSGDQGAPAGRR